MENQNVKFRQTVRELRQIAKERKIKYYYKMRREELLSALRLGTNSSTSASVNPNTRVVPNPNVRVRIGTNLIRIVPNTSASVRTVQNPTVRIRIGAPVVNESLNQSILDKPIPGVPSTILTPTTRKYVPPQPPQIQKSTNNNSIADWIMSGIDLIKNAPKKVMNYGIEAYDSFKSKTLNLYKHNPIEFKLTESVQDYVTRKYTATNDASSTRSVKDPGTSASDELSFMKSAKRRLKH